MLISSQELLADAREGGYAVPHFNYWSRASLQAHIRVAEAVGRPVILGIAEAHSHKMTLEEGVVLGRYYGERASVPVVVHLDHGRNLENVRRGIDNGFTSVMIDASEEDYEVNVARTREVVDYAHAKGIQVEAEIGHVGDGSTYGAANDDTIYTAVDLAEQFVERTGADSLAVSIGTAHGAYSGTPQINFERLHELREGVGVPLVLHGGSSSGDENLARAAREGIAKINIFTDFMTAAFAAVKSVQPSTWWDLEAVGFDAMTALGLHYFEVFQHAAGTVAQTYGEGTTHE